MHNFFLHQSKGMTVKNFARVVKKFLSAYFLQRETPFLLVCKRMHFYNSPSNQHKNEIIQII